MKYRKKPVIIEAIQIGTNLEEVRNFVGDKGEIYVDKGTIYVNIHTLEGTMTASSGDFIIRGVEGELYPCRENIFYKTYELIGETE